MSKTLRNHPTSLYGIGIETWQQIDETLKFHITKPSNNPDADLINALHALESDRAIFSQRSEKLSEEIMELKRKLKLIEIIISNNP